MRFITMPNDTPLIGQSLDTVREFLATKVAERGQIITYRYLAVGVEIEKQATGIARRDPVGYEVILRAAIKIAVFPQNIAATPQ